MTLWHAPHVRRDPSTLLAPCPRPFQRQRKPRPDTFSREPELKSSRPSAYFLNSRWPPACRGLLRTRTWSRTVGRGVPPARGLRRAGAAGSEVAQAQTALVREDLQRCLGGAERAHPRVVGEAAAATGRVGGRPASLGSRGRGGGAEGRRPRAKRGGEIRLPGPCWPPEGGSRRPGPRPSAVPRVLTGVLPGARLEGGRFLESTSSGTPNLHPTLPSPPSLTCPASVRRVLHS